MMGDCIHLTAPVPASLREFNPFVCLLAVSSNGRDLLQICSDTDKLTYELLKERNEVLDCPAVRALVV